MRTHASLLEELGSQSRVPLTHLGRNVSLVLDYELVGIQIERLWVLATKPTEYYLCSGREEHAWLCDYFPVSVRFMNGRFYHSGTIAFVEYDRWLSNGVQLRSNLLRPVS